MPSDWTPQPVALRAWQQRAYDTYLSRNLENFLLWAWPGAGKTRVALYIAGTSLDVGETERLVVVTSTDHLRWHWVGAAALFGIQLDNGFTNRMLTGEASDFHGVVVTYAQVARNPELHRALCAATPTFLVLDEPHHTAASLTWGDQTRYAFEPARRRLLITGTPYRSDDYPIPFVAYPNGKAERHFDYGYGDALRDGVVRALYFPSFEGTFRWHSTRDRSDENPDGMMTATFGDDLSDEASRRRLATALDPRGNWLRGVLREADHDLLELRQHIYPYASGLLIAKDQDHARAGARVLTELTGEVPALAISDDPDASAVIAAFSRPDLRPQPRWIVAVKLIAEGVDLPHLFVGVYATNVTTLLGFDQMTGRVLRMLPGVPGQIARFYLPAIEPLLTYAVSMKREREHVLGDADAAQTQRQAAERAAGQSIFTPLGSESRPDDVIFDDEVFHQHEVADARRIMAQAKIGQHQLTDVEVVRLYRVMRGAVTDGPAGQAPSHTAPVASDPLTLVQTKKHLRDAIIDLVSRLVGLTAGREPDHFFDYRFCYGLLAVVTGSYQEQATEDDLRYRIRTLTDWLALVQRADGPRTADDWRRLADDARRPAA